MQRGHSNSGKLTFSSAQHVAVCMTGSKLTVMPHSLTSAATCVHNQTAKPMVNPSLAPQATPAQARLPLLLPMFDQHLAIFRASSKLIVMLQSLTSAAMYVSD